MIDAKRRKQIIAEHGKPDPVWPGEPLLGGWYTEEEIAVVERTIRESMDWTVGFGLICPEIVEFEQAFAAFAGTADMVSVNGAGSALDMAMMCLDLEPEDEVIVPSINFRASAMSVIGQGGRLVLGEIDPRTFQLDPAHVEKLMTPNTRAIYPTHMNGLSAPIEEYLAIAERHPHRRHGPAKVIGDAARACGGGYQRGKIGKAGWMTVFSYHTQKNMTTLGEGGGITTDDLELAGRLRTLRQFGSADSWGTNYKLTKVQAAVGVVQTRRLPDFIARRRVLGKQRDELLADVPELTVPYEPPDCEHSYYLYTCLVPKEWAGEKRDQLCAIMGEEYGVGCIVANPPMHTTIPFIRKHAVNTDLPVSEEIGARLFCVSLHPLMTPEDNEYACAALIETVERLRKD